MQKIYDQDGKWICFGPSNSEPAAQPAGAESPADRAGPRVEVNNPNYTHITMYAQLASWVNADYDRLLLGQSVMFL